MRFFFLVLAITFIGLAYGTYLYLPKTPRPDEMSALNAETAALTSEVAELRAGLENSVCSGAAKTIPARVYSTYPFSVKNEITLDRGSADGLLKNDAVLLGCSIFVGRLADFTPHTSVAVTIFDNRMEAPVLIGANRANGLLKGGATPAVTLVEHDIAEGDDVFIADKRFPYGLVIGKIGAVRQGSGGSILKEADVVPAFGVADLRDVEIVQ